MFLDFICVSDRYETETYSIFISRPHKPETYSPIDLDAGHLRSDSLRENIGRTNRHWITQRRAIAVRRQSQRSGNFSSRGRWRDSHSAKNSTRIQNFVNLRRVRLGKRSRWFESIYRRRQRKSGVPFVFVGGNGVGGNREDSLSLG